MLDAPIDLGPVWLGTALTATLGLSIALSFPVAPPPDAAAAAATVDAVAASEGAATATHSVTAERIRLTRDGLALRTDRGSAQARYAFGPVTPVTPQTPLARVLAGRAPAAVFDSPAALREALDRARNRAPVVVETARLRVRHVRWEGIDVTLVG